MNEHKSQESKTALSKPAFRSRKQRQQENAEKKAAEIRDWQAAKALFLPEFETALQQNQPNRLLVLIDGEKDCRALLFRYDTQLAGSVGWLLYAQNLLVQYNRLVSEAAGAIRNGNRAAITTLCRRRDLQDLEINSDRIMEQLAFRSEQIARRSAEKQLLVEQFSVPADGRIRRDISAGKYIIVFLASSDLSYGCIFEKEEGLPLFLSFGNGQWENIYHPSKNDRPHPQAGAGNSPDPTEKRAEILARLARLRKYQVSLKDLIRSDRRSDLERIPSLAQKAGLCNKQDQAQKADLYNKQDQAQKADLHSRLGRAQKADLHNKQGRAQRKNQRFRRVPEKRVNHQDSPFLQKYQQLYSLHLLARKDAGAISELVRDQWKLADYDLRILCHYCKGTGLEPCNSCKNTGICQRCKGTGSRTEQKTIMSRKKIETQTSTVSCPPKCTYCEGHTKKCRVCKGATGILNGKAVKAALEKERAGLCAWIDAQIADGDRVADEMTGDAGAFGISFGPQTANGGIGTYNIDPPNPASPFVRYEVSCNEKAGIYRICGETKGEPIPVLLEMTQVFKQFKSQQSFLQEKYGAYYTCQNADPNKIIYSLGHREIVLAIRTYNDHGVDCCKLVIEYLDNKRKGDMK